jgi:spermidine synthase
VNPWTLIDSAEIKKGGGELRLYRRGNDYSIMIAGVGELMSSRTYGSEEKLAELGCRRATEQSQPRVLVGGLGIGFTLAAALGQLGPDVEVVVAELVPAVVHWNREYLGQFAGHPLDDPRTTVTITDVAALLRTEQGGYDAILLDVDNGPEGLTHRGNDWLYRTAGLQAAYDALRPNGILAVWSAGPDALFGERLRRVGFIVEEHRVRAHRDRRGARHIIWVAERYD